MTNRYVDFGVAASGDGVTSWAQAYKTLPEATAAAAGGDIIYIASTSAETAAATKTLTCGTVTAPVFIYSVNKAGSFPPVAADLLPGASVSTTSTFWPIITGFAYYNGLTFNCGTTGSGNFGALSTSAAGWLRFDNCIFTTTATGGPGFQFGFSGGGNNPQKIELVNCTFKFASTAHSLRTGWADFLWRDTPSALVSGSSVPTTLFPSSNNNETGTYLIEAVDLSAINTTLVDAHLSCNKFIFRKCKFNASVVYAAAPTSIGGGQTIIENCSDTTAYYRIEYFAYQGTEKTDIGVFRTGGATDGLNPYSRKIVTTANNSPQNPFEALPLSVMNKVTGSNVTVTVFGNAASLPTNTDVWIEALYMGTSGNPLGVRATSAPANILTAGSNSGMSDGVSSWTGGTTAFQMQCTLVAPVFPGIVDVFVKVGHTGIATYYIDPKPVLS